MIVNGPPVEYQPIVSKIVHAISTGVQPAQLESYLRAAGWFEVGGKEVSDETFAGLVTIAMHQMTMETGGPAVGVKAKREEAYSMARSIAFAALMSGDFKNAVSATKVMAEIVNGIQKPADKKPNTAKRPALPDISIDDIARHLSSDGPGPIGDVI